MTQPIAAGTPRKTDGHDPPTLEAPKLPPDVDATHARLDTLRSTTSDRQADAACAAACTTTTSRGRVLYVDGISPDDVRQGKLGDCTLQACLASIARSPGGRVYLRNMISESHDAKGAVTGYEVKLFEKTAKGYEPRRVQVPPDCLVSKGYQHATLGVDGPEEAWPRVIEAAVFALHGCSAPGDVPDSYGMLTGKTAATSSPGASSFENKIVRDYNAGKMQILSTSDALAGSAGGFVRGSVTVAERHAYSVERIESRSVRQPNGEYAVETLVTLRNPWGFDHPRPMTMAEVKHYFTAYSVADMPGPGPG